VRRALSWAVTLPLTAAGVLCAHAAAYRALGAPSEGVHGYLAHAPQLVAVLGSVALAALVVESRAATRSAWPFAAVALSAFACQEHVERLAHTGELPWLLTRPVFLLGLALQLPFALAAWLLARLLLRVRAAPRARPPRVPALLLPLPSRAVAATAVPALPLRPGRGPPAVL
jgi:hypothetical protein